MCLAIPMRITEVLDNGLARAEVGGVVRDISLVLMDEVAVGDYVIAHVGFALSKLDQAEARATLALFAEAGMFEGLTEEAATP